MQEVEDNNAARLPDIRTLKRQLAETNFLKMENLIFEGGGAKGVAYVGAIEVSMMNIIPMMCYKYHVCILQHTWQLGLQACIFGGMGEEGVDGLLNFVSVGRLNKGCTSTSDMLNLDYDWSMSTKIKRSYLFAPLI